MNMALDTVAPHNERQAECPPTRYFSQSLIA